MKLIFAIAFSVILNPCIAQETDHSMKSEENILPYAEIPAYPEEYNSCTVAARMIDGLGFRYYWATEGLRQEDLDFKPSEDARATIETVDHIHGLVNTILNSVKILPNIRGGEKQELTFAEKRKQTLLNLQEASEILKGSDPADIENFKIIFQRGENKSEFPFWNQLNGPIADAIWHCGQLVSFRRSSGNPLRSGVSVFSGTVRN